MLKGITFKSNKIEKKIHLATLYETAVNQIQLSSEQESVRIINDTNQQTRSFAESSQI